MAARPRSPLRFLAPLALVGAALALFFVLRSSELVAGSPTTQAAPAREAATGDAAREQRAASRRRSRRSAYRVRPGDTLAAIAERTDVEVEQLQELNPELDAQTLTPGQRIKLRE